MPIKAVEPVTISTCRLLMVKYCSSISLIICRLGFELLDRIAVSEVIVSPFPCMVTVAPAPMPGMFWKTTCSLYGPDAAVTVAVTLPLTPQLDK
jgi:hypothetical protein